MAIGTVYVLAVVVGYYMGDKHAGRLRQIEAETDTEGHTAGVSFTDPEQSHPEHIDQMDGGDCDTWWDETDSHAPDRPAESDE